MTSTEPAIPASPSSNFLRQVIDADLQAQRFAGKRWCPPPAVADQLAKADLDTARIRTRFPPEPNGFLHIGHAKSICLNFGLARDYGGVCHLRFDDTNPEKEDQAYVDAIIDAVRWLGFDWKAGHAQSAQDKARESQDRQDSQENHENLYFASDYFEVMYGFAQLLIQAGLAYVDQQNAEQMRETPRYPRPPRAPIAPGVTVHRKSLWRSLKRCAKATHPDRQSGAQSQNRHGLAQHEPA